MQHCDRCSGVPYRRGRTCKLSAHIPFPFIAGMQLAPYVSPHPSSSQRVREIDLRREPNRVSGVTWRRTEQMLLLLLVRIRYTTGCFARMKHLKAFVRQVKPNSLQSSTGWTTVRRVCTRHVFLPVYVEDRTKTSHRCSALHSAHKCQINY